MSAVQAQRRVKRLLLIGNCHSATPGTRSIIEDLAERLEGTCVSRYESSLPRGLQLVWQALARRHAYDAAIVDVYSGRTFLWTEIAAATLRAARRPFVLVLRGGGLPAFSARHAARVRRCLQHANLVVVPSGYLHDGMRKYREDLRVIPNPVDLSRCEFRWRQAVQPKLVWLRAFRRFYNPAMAADVLADLSTDLPDVHLTMIGPDKGDGSGADTNARAHALGVESRITRAGGVAKRDVPGWLQRGDILINTADADNMPVSVLEAMACGLCVVSTNVGGMPYLIDHEHNGLLVPPRDPKAMAAAVRRIVGDPALASRLSRAARTKAEQFDWPSVLPQWQQLLQDAALA